MGLGEHEADGGQRVEGPVAAGELLRVARERSGRSVEQCAVSLRARPMQIVAMERGDLADFGGDIYARGFLRSYARLVGVDPERILELHGRDPGFGGPILPTHAPIRLRRGAPAWLLGLVGVVVVAAVITAVLGLGGRRAPQAVPPTDPGLEEPGRVEDPAPTPPPVVDPVPAPVPAGPPVDVVMTFEAPSWLEVLVDGIAVEPGVLVPAGETLRFFGQESVVLRLGNAGGVRVELNGEELGAPGRSGQVLRVGYGPDGVLDADG
jgi:cytoskeleton protein RodZ